MIPIEVRQSFMLKGKAWQRGGIKPLDGLTKLQLRKELQAHGSNAPLLTMTKLELQKEFHTQRKGITNFPALLTSNPQVDLVETNLHHYEISPSEPLHDLKGHMANLIGEIKGRVTGLTKTEVDKVISATLSKDTLRCVDYRKAAILLSSVLHKTNTDSTICSLIDTAAEICQLMYAREEARSPKAILRLYNLTLRHAVFCNELFQAPKSITRRKMFGRYFHAISTHAASMYRLVALRSLNTEMQERLFNMCNDITKSTSNRHSSHVINNAVIRVQQESDATATSIKKQEGEVATLASGLKPFPNTFISKEWTKKQPYLWQAHLERISDFMMHGPGVWWKEHTGGVEFLDGPEEDSSKPEGPPLHHFRSCSLKEEETYLKRCWHTCIQAKIPLPFCTLRVYNEVGELNLIETCDSERVHMTGTVMMRTMKAMMAMMAMMMRMRGMKPLLIYRKLMEIMKKKMIPFTKLVIQHCLQPPLPLHFPMNIRQSYVNSFPWYWEILNFYGNLTSSDTR